jgi:hypothetical protein
MFVLPLFFILLFMWLLFRPTRRSRRRMDSAPQPEPPDEPIEHMEETIMVAIVGEDADVTMCKIRVPLQQEVFTPPLPQGTYYKLIFTGTCAVKFYSTWDCFDACYKATSGRHNYTDRHRALNLDGRVLTASPIESDRAEHRYVFPYRATGSRLSVLLESPVGNLRNASDIKGDIQLTVVALSRAEVSELGLDAEEREREAAARRMIEELEEQARELAVATYSELHLLDPQYRVQYAKQHHTHMTKLKDQWLAQYRAVLSDELLRTLLEEQHPHVMPVLAARMEVLSIVERLPYDEQIERAKRDEERAAQARAERIADLVLTYHEFAHYADEQWIADYVAIPKHQQELRAEWSEILKKHQKFHEDKAFIDELKACSPATYRRATWEMRALALADKLSARRRLSDEEKAEKILRHRQRDIDYLRVGADDKIALMLERLVSAQRLREKLEQLGVDDDEIERLEQELLGDLDQDDDGQSNGYRQLR